MVTRMDNLISAEAWNDLKTSYDAAGGEEADDHTLAELLRLKMIEVEG